MYKEQEHKTNTVQPNVDKLQVSVSKIISCQKMAENYLKDTKHNKTSLGQKLTDNRGSDDTKQLKGGDRFYWVKPDGGSWTYVGKFKNHATANNWWRANKSRYPGGQFSQGNSKKKFK